MTSLYKRRKEAVIISIYLLLQCTMVILYLNTPFEKLLTGKEVLIISIIVSIVALVINSFAILTSKMDEQLKSYFMYQVTLIGIILTALLLV